MSEFSNYGRLAETIFVLPIDVRAFVKWLEVRADRERNIGVAPSLKHYHGSHLYKCDVKSLDGVAEYAIGRDVMNGGGWHRLPVVGIHILSLSASPFTNQCEVWVVRLYHYGQIEDNSEQLRSAESVLGSCADTEYEKITSDILARWPSSVLSSTDLRESSSANPKLSISQLQNGLQPSREKLRMLLVERFNEDEIRTLCFDLEIDYEVLPGIGKAGKVRELVLYCIRHNRFSDLIVKLCCSRPDLVEDMNA